MDLNAAPILVPLPALLGIAIDCASTELAQPNKPSFSYLKVYFPY
jgi:hypothetical protein